ncbi:tetratricopeptide repeat protein [Fimbriimonas ginsengisoli]|uniref:Uncharacterized protein n=1 Tax=Fimbriimonas ginsengisoli Gsoil 348 TaxID=661478 RepID=A0A068NZ18_FIMGI|nr:hypothetical protein [Fimbriimonas ginsengisoli]AIE87799.1 hypothetical protein OP10G_4431 [Fimbriimonas ginsengisoli Gsoil 348]
MQTNEGWKRWSIPVGIVVALVMVLLLSNRDVPTPTGLPRIMDLDTYRRDLNNASQIAAPIFAKYDDGAEISESERADLRKCAQVFDTVSTFLPAKSGSFLDAGRCYVILEDWESAEQRLQQCLNNSTLKDSDFSPKGVGDAKRLMSVVRNQQGRFEDAYRLADEALKIDPSDASSLVARASAEVQLKHIPAARVDIAKSLQLWPGNKRALQLQQLLETATGK